jgi:hypothetical protein
LTILLDLANRQRQLFRADAESAKKYVAIGDRKPPSDIDPVELATAAAVASAILNLDAAVMVR